MIHEIFVIEDKEDLIKELKNTFNEDDEIVFKKVSSSEINDHLLDIPTLIIINEDQLVGTSLSEVCKIIRNNEDNSITPIMVLTSNNTLRHEKAILKNEVEYYIIKPIDNECLFYMIKNIIKLLYRNRGISPLTKLPGNLPIQSELKKRLLKRQEFAVLYFDLDNFKAYNDTYGFLGGDEIIKETARIIIKNVNDSGNAHNFIGHIGGDDFVALVTNKNYEELCQNIILEFDKKILDYFSEEDIERGYLEVPNRKGIMEEFPLVSISIGVVEVSKGRFHNILEIGEVGAQVKHLAKVTPGSAYAINRRTHE